MANKLKNLIMNSVDFVKRGANPDADIKLYKSASNVVMKSDDEVMDMIEKSGDTIFMYTDALAKSLTSALQDTSMTDSEVREFMRKSLSEFDDAVKNDIISGFSYTAETPAAKKTKYKESEVGKMADLTALFDTIDKSALSPSESEQLEALLAKACKTKKAVDDPDMEDDDFIDMEDDDDMRIPMRRTKKGCDPDMKKSAGIIPPAIQAALDRMESLAKGMEMKDYMEIAKKYTILGEDQEKLAKSLYDMKQNGEDAYNSYVSALDKSVSIMEKSGMFGEIGKSAYGKDYTGVGSRIQKGETVAKVESIAKGYMEKDPTLDYTSAMAKAWENNPDLAVEYESSIR